MTEDQRQALRADLAAQLEALHAEDEARRAEARARGEALYPEPGFKASRLVEPEPLGDFGYLSDRDLGRKRRNAAAGPAPDPREAAARERAAMAALKARRGCPLWVDETYVEVLRRQGGWWNDRPL